MNHFFKLLIVLVALTSCKTEKKQETPQNVTIEASTPSFEMNESSIRAIEIINDDHIAFAGSKGDVGIISEKNGVVFKHDLKKDTVIPYFRSLALVNEHIFALAIGNPALLYKVNKDGFELVYEENHEKVFYDSLHFFDEINGIAMGDSIDGCLSIITTNDGGNSWTKIPCENLPETTEGENAFAASDTNISIYKSHVWIASGGMKARVFHSSNMGKGWEVFETPIIQGKETTGIYTIDFYDENHGIIAGGDFTDKFGNSANKAITKDGGKTWEVVSEGLAPKYVSCVQYIPGSNAQKIIAVSTNGVFRSDNGGVSWNKIEEEGFYTVRVIDENNMWFAGANKIKKLKFN